MLPAGIALTTIPQRANGLSLCRRSGLSGWRFLSELAEFRPATRILLQFGWPRQDGITRRSGNLLSTAFHGGAEQYVGQRSLQPANSGFPSAVCQSVHEYQ